MFTPFPTRFIWAGGLLPTLLIAFISEGSKFLFLDTAFCRSPVWYPSGTDSFPQMASSCYLGKSANFSIAAIVTFFVSVLLVCFLSPTKRELDHTFGEDRFYMDGNGCELDTSLEDDHLHEIDLNLSNISHEDSFLVIQNRVGSEYASSLGEGNSFEYSYPIANENDTFFGIINDVEQGTIFEDQERPAQLSLDITSYDSQDNRSKGSSDCLPDDEDPASTHDDKENRPSIGTKGISDSRMAMAEDMKVRNEISSDDVIQKCVLDLTRSFHTDDVEVFENDDESDSQPGDDEDQHFAKERSGMTEPSMIEFAHQSPSSAR